MKASRFYPFDNEPPPDTCWSLSAGPDGRIYAASCCERIAGGGVYIVRYDDETDSLKTIVDVPRAVGEPADNGKATQCKIHYSFAPSLSDGILYAATHLSAPGVGSKRFSPWADWKDDARAFPHSCLLALDTSSDQVLWTDTFIPREGCRCMALDERRGRLYAISYPRDHFWVYDLKKREIRSLGRLGSVNSQTIFTDRRGRVFVSNCSGQFVRYDPDSDRLEEIPIFVPHDPRLSGWHDVLYDVVASPQGDCVYGVPWNTDPHLFRYWPEDGEYGRIEDLGAVHQWRDPGTVVCFYLDHCGGLVFGADGKLYYATTRWSEGSETDSPHFGRVQTEVIVVQMDVQTLERTDYARLERNGARGHYVARAARDRRGNLFFGHVIMPSPTGISRLEMNAQGDDLHLPLRTWG